MPKINSTQLQNLFRNLSGDNNPAGTVKAENLDLKNVYIGDIKNVYIGNDNEVHVSKSGFMRWIAQKGNRETGAEALRKALIPHLKNIGMEHDSDQWLPAMLDCIGGNAPSTRRTNHNSIEGNLHAVMAEARAAAGIREYERMGNVHGQGAIKAASTEIGDKHEDITLPGNLARLKNKLRDLNDVRGNNVLATQAESSWAVGTLRSMTEKEMDATLDHLNEVATLLAEQGPKVLAKNESFSNIAGPEENRTWEQLAQKVANLRGNCSVSEFAEFTLSSTVKNAIDFVGWAPSVLAPEGGSPNFREGVPEFDDRGRKEQASSRDSMRDQHGGIVAAEYRRDSVTDFYTNELNHAKGGFERKTTGTPERFRKAGAPFIAGASGTIGFIAQHLITSQSPLESNERCEKLLGTYFATLVAGGHHSLSECLIAAKANGYFTEIPHPLEDYNEAMRLLGAHLQQLGLANGGKSMEAAQV